MTRSLVLTPQFFGSLLFDRHTSRYLPFDAEATRLLRRLVFEPVDAVLATAPEALGFVDQLADAGYLDLEGHLAAEVLDLVPPSDHLAGPLAVHLEVIGACNLTCRHCFAGELPRNEHPLRIAEIDALAATLARMGCFRLGLTGGEPLMRRDLFDILDAAADHGLHPCLTTNGLLITEEIARQFGRRRLVWLNVSLDGATAATNDRIRGAGTFDRVLDGCASSAATPASRWPSRSRATVRRRSRPARPSPVTSVPTPPCSVPSTPSASRAATRS